jgi:hypothetical protein
MAFYRKKPTTPASKVPAQGIGYIVIGSAESENGNPSSRGQTMRSQKHLLVFPAGLTVILEFLALATPLFASSKEKLLHRFCPAGACPDGDPGRRYDL